MTVAELVRILAGHPAELRVVVNGYEGGYDDLSPSQVAVEPIALDTGVHDWEGRHGHPADGSTGGSEPVRIVDALVLRRRSN